MKTQANSKDLDRQLISEYARREEISPKEAERQLQSMIDVTRDVLLLASHVRLRRFGEFYIGKRKNAKYKNKATGLHEMIPMIKVVRFRPARSLKQELNTKVKTNFLDKFKC